ncbi:MAG: hypothetical protein RLN62_03785 [Rickettsiales bacterium]
MSNESETVPVISEDQMSDADILSQAEYKSAVISKRASQSRIGGFLVGMFNGFWNSPPVGFVRESAVGKGIGWTAGKVNDALEHPLGKTVTFVLAVSLGALAVAGTGGIALAIPAAALTVTIGAKLVKAGFKAQHENKMHSLEHQLDLLRTLKKKVISHERTIEEIKSRTHESQHESIHSHRDCIAQVDDHRAVGPDGKTHTRNLPTLRNEIMKSAASNSLYVAGAALDATALPRSAVEFSKGIHSAHAAIRGAHTGGDIASQSADIREGTIGVAHEAEEQFQGADKEAVLKARINLLSKELGVPPCQNTAELTSFVRGKMSSLRAEERVVEEHAASVISADAARDKFVEYKKEADKSVILDSEIKEQMKRANYTKRMAVRVGEALFGSKEEWVGKKTEPTPPSVPSVPPPNKGRDSEGPSI